MRSKFILAAVLSLLTTGAAFAQKDARAELGLKPEKLYQFGDLDNVNLFNGNLSLSIPLGPRYPVGGNLSYQLALVYNSKVWDYEEVVITDALGKQHYYYIARPNLRSNAGVGWRLSLGRLNPQTGPTVNYTGTTGWLYESPSGAEYWFRDFGAAEPDFNAEVLFTSDAAMRMVRVSASERFIEMPNGEIHTFSKQGSDWRLDKIADRFGNAVTISYETDVLGKPVWRITDTTLRSLVVNFEFETALSDSADAGQVVKQISLPGVGGVPAQYTLVYENQLVPHGCGHVAPTGFTDPTTPQDTATHTHLPFLKSVSLPDQTAFDFSYHSASSHCEQGALSQVTLPTKGVVQYDYQTYFLPADRCAEPGWADRPVGLRKRTTPDGVWDYVQNVGPFVSVDDGPQTFPQGVPGPCGFRDDGTGLGYTVPPRRWTRTTVLSPPTPRQGLDRRTRNDHYFDIWTVSPQEDPLGQGFPNGYSSGHYGEQAVPGAPSPSSSRMAPIGFNDGPVTTTDESVVITVNGKRRALASRTFEDCSVDGSCNGLSRSAYVLPTIAAGYTAPTLFMPRIQATTTVYDDMTWPNGVAATDSGCGAPGCYVDEEGSDPDFAWHFRRTAVRSNFPHSTPVDLYTAYSDWSSHTTRTNKTIPWLPEIFSETRRTEGSSTVITQFCFDSLGFLTRRRTLAGLIPGASDVLSVFVRDARGEMVIERHFGGDVQQISGLGACNAEPVSSTEPQYEIHHEYTNGIRRRSEYWYPNGVAMGFTTLDLTIDPWTGVVRYSRDAALVETEYKYHPVPARLYQVSSPGAAPVDYSYTPASSGVWSRIDIVTSGQTDTLRKRVEYDGMGRLFRESTLMPGENWSAVETVFDGLGRKKEVTVPIDTGTTAPGNAALAGSRSRFEYDSAGRMLKSTAPDLSVTSFALTGVRKSIRTSNIAGPTGSDQSVQVTEEYDNLGRLRTVTEPSGPTTSDTPFGVDVTTAYRYNALGLLTEVRMAGGIVQNPRTFEYDGRGFLLAETHPESSRTVYEQYDARGHFRKRTIGGDTRRDLFFSRDPAERLLSVSEPEPDPTAGGTRPLKQFVYRNQDPDPSNKVRGKVASAIRYNYAPIQPWSSPLALGPVTVEESYCYCDAVGRLTRRITSISTTDEIGTLIPIRQIDQGVTYNDLGLVETSTYPSCTYCGYSTYHSFTDVKWTYDKGRVKAIKAVDQNGVDIDEFVDDTRYWPSGALQLRVHSNSIGDEQQADSSGRPAALRFGVPSQTFNYSLSGYVSCEPPQIHTQPASTTATQGQATTLQFGLNGTGPFTYQWYEYDETTNSSTAIAGAVNATLTVWPQSTASYFVRVSNDCLYQDSSLATITVSGSCEKPTIKSLSAAGVTNSSPLNISATTGATVVMTVSAAGTAPLSYQWSRVEAGGDVPLGSGSSISVTVTSAKTYRVVVSNSCPSGSVTGTVSVNVALPTPTALTATRSGSTEITLSWPGVAGASYYGVERKEAGADFTFLGWSSTTSYVDPGRQPATDYAYRVYAVDANYGSKSSPSNVDLATTLTFTPVAAGMIIDDAHLHELLTSVNAARAVSSLPPLSWPQILPNGSSVPAVGALIQASHLTALRREMNIALQAIGAAALPFTDPQLSGLPIKAVHIVEMQQRGQ